MTLESIKAAIDRGQTVCWSNGYNKVKEKANGLVVHFGMSDRTEPVSRFLSGGSADLFYIEAINEH